jgi:hypothetical protein
MQLPGEGRIYPSTSWLPYNEYDKIILESVHLYGRGLARPGVLGRCANAVDGKESDTLLPSDATGQSIWNLLPLHSGITERLRSGRRGLAPRDVGESADRNKSPLILRLQQYNKIKSARELREAVRRLESEDCRCSVWQCRI